jgi:2-oxoglutarate ferredoxin oxidoreductase subunit delta
VKKRAFEKQQIKKRTGGNLMLKLKTVPKYCKGCGICVEFCPKKVLELDELGKIVIANEKDCIVCKQCELRCPDFAVYFVHVDD